MYMATQFSIFMVNKPGVLAHVLSEFAKAKLNMVAMTMVDTAEHGVIRVVFGDAEKSQALLDKLNLPYNKTEVLCMTLTNKAGALALVAEKLAKSHLNISYAYCTAGARGGRTTGILKVADVKKAIKILDKDSAKKTKKSKSKIRPAKSSKK